MVVHGESNKKMFNFNKEIFVQKCLKKKAQKYWICKRGQEY